MSDRVLHHFTMPYVNTDYLVDIDFTYDELNDIAEYKPPKLNKAPPQRSVKEHVSTYQRRLEEVATATTYAEHLESIGYVPPKKFNLKG